MIVIICLFFYMPSVSAPLSAFIATRISSQNFSLFLAIKSLSIICESHLFLTSFLPVLRVSATLLYTVYLPTSIEEIYIRFYVLPYIYRYTYICTLCFNTAVAFRAIDAHDLASLLLKSSRLQ